MLTALMRELAAILRTVESSNARLHTWPHLGVARQVDKLMVVQRSRESCVTLTRFVQTHPGGKLGPTLALDVLRDIARGLQELHAQGISDLDLNPDCILLTGSGLAVISNLGLGRIVNMRTKVPASTANALVNYQPPEKYSSSAYSGPMCDIWSLACIMIHVLTGQAPMAGLTALEIMGKVRGLSWARV